MSACDCERSHNGIGLAGRKCDCECAHEWEEYESMGTNEWFTDVRCAKCGEYGQRDESDKTVFWPAT